MPTWRKQNQTICSWPSNPEGLIEMIGGSYLSATPQISYRYLLESLLRKNLAVHAWKYVPGFDHQAQANEAWKNFRECREKLESRIGGKYEPIRLGHSLGCKLHLLAPDGGRNSKSLIALSFNNFNADKSIPMLGKVKRKLNIYTEFSPSPSETMNLILKKYNQPNNLLIKFSNDNIDQNIQLLDILKNRSTDNSNMIVLNGDHLTPIKTGFRESFPKESFLNTGTDSNIIKLVDTIISFSKV